MLITLFSLGGAVFGMGEKALPFVMILVPMFVAMGYDAIVGLMCSYVATQIGFGSSWMNPFSLAVAQGISGIPVLSGAPYRILLWFLFTGFAIFYTMHYAKKVKLHPELSVAYESDAYYRNEFQSADASDSAFTAGHKLVVLTLVLTIIWTVWGVVAKGYYIPEIASQFFVMGLVSGIIGVIFKLNNMKPGDIATAFQLGDAFSNVIVPTSGVLLGALAAARLDWGRWAKFQIKFQSILFACGSVAVIAAVLIGFT